MKIKKKNPLSVMITSPSGGTKNADMVRKRKETLETYKMFQIGQITSPIKIRRHRQSVFSKQNNPKTGEHT